MLDDSAEMRLQRAVEHLHKLGSRAVVAAIAEIERCTGDSAAALTVLATYETITPAMLRATGGDRFPRVPPRVVPA